MQSASIYVERLCLRQIIILLPQNYLLLCLKNKEGFVNGIVNSNASTVVCTQSFDIIWAL